MDNFFIYFRELLISFNSLHNMDTNTLFKFNDWITDNEWKVTESGNWESIRYSRESEEPATFQELKDLFFAEMDQFKTEEGTNNLF